MVTNVVKYSRNSSKVTVYGIFVIIKLNGLLSISAYFYLVFKGNSMHYNNFEREAFSSMSHSQSVGMSSS